MELNRTGADLGMKSSSALLAVCWSSRSSAEQQKAAYRELVRCSKLPDQQKELTACLQTNATEWRITRLLALMYESDQPLPTLWQALLAARLPPKGGTDDMLLWILRTICQHKTLPPGATIDAVMKRFGGNLCLAATDELFVLLIGALRATELLRNAVAQIRSWLVVGRGFDKDAILTAQCLFLLHCGEQATQKDFSDAIEALQFRDAGQVHAAEHLARALGTDAAKAVVAAPMVRRFLVVLVRTPRQLVQDRRAVIFLLEGRLGPLACQQFLYDAHDELPISTFMGVRGFTACLARSEFGANGLRRLEVFLRLIDAPRVVPALALAELCEVLLQTRYGGGMTWVYLFNLLDRVNDDQLLLRAMNAIVAAHGSGLVDVEHQSSWLGGLKAFRPRSRLGHLAFAAALLRRSPLRDEVVWQIVERALTSSTTGGYLGFSESDLLITMIRELLFPRVGMAPTPVPRLEQALDVLVNVLGEGRTRQLFDEIDRYLAVDDAQPGTVVCEDDCVRAICASLLRAALRSNKGLAALLPHNRLLGQLCLQAFHEAPNDPQVLALPKPTTDAMAWAQQLVEVSLLRCIAGLPADSPQRPPLQSLLPSLHTRACEFTAAALALAYPGTPCALHLEPLTRLRGRASGFFDALVAAIVPGLVERQEVYVQMLLNGLMHGSLKIGAIHAAADWRSALRAADPKPAQHVGEPKCDHFDLVFCGDSLPVGIALDASPMWTSPELGALASEWLGTWRAALHALAAHAKASTPEAKELDAVLRTHLAAMLHAVFGPQAPAAASPGTHALDVAQTLAGADPHPAAPLPPNAEGLARVVQCRADAVSFGFVTEVEQACSALLAVAPKLLGQDAEAALLEKLQSVHQRLLAAMTQADFGHRFAALDLCRFELLPKDRFDNLFIGLALGCELSPWRRGGPLLVEWLAGPFLLVGAHGAGGELLAVCALLFGHDPKTGQRVLAMDACYAAPPFLLPLGDTQSISGASLLDGFVAQAVALARSFGAARLYVPCAVGKDAIEFWKPARAPAQAQASAFTRPVPWGGSPVTLLGFDDDDCSCWCIDPASEADPSAKPPAQ